MNAVVLAIVLGIMAHFYRSLVNLCLALSLVLVVSNAFQQHIKTVAFSSSTRLRSTTTPTLTPMQQQRRRALLKRNGPYFELNRMTGKIEFGSTVNLVTQLDRTGNLEMIAGWLSDERRVAFSIWDKNLITELGDSVYQLQIMTLQFVTIQLTPTVDIKMWTENESELPVFSLHSISFDPNLQILPGIGLSAASLGIVIEVTGELRPTQDGRGVTGRITFQTKGDLPPPMRLLPDPLLKAASDSINETVSRFAAQSFQRGAVAKYGEFRQAAMQQKNTQIDKSTS